MSAKKRVKKAGNGENESGSNNGLLGMAASMAMKAKAWRASM